MIIVGMWNMFTKENTYNITKVNNILINCNINFLKTKIVN